MYRIEVAETWEQVDAAAYVDRKCIREDGPNNAKARLAWDIFKRDGSLLYYIVRCEHVHPGPPPPVSHDHLCGYVRMLRVATQTWVVDYVTPASFEILVMVAQVIDGAVLAKQFIAGDFELVRGCPRITVSFPRLDMFPYRIQHATESQFVVVVPTLVSAAPGSVSQVEPLEHMGAGI